MKRRISPQLLINFRQEKEMSKLPTPLTEEQERIARANVEILNTLNDEQLNEVVTGLSLPQHGVFIETTKRDLLETTKLLLEINEDLKKGERNEAK